MSDSEFQVPMTGAYFYSFGVSFVGGDGVDDTSYIHLFRASDGADASSIHSTAVNPSYFTRSSPGVELVQSLSGVARLNAGDLISVRLQGVDLNRGCQIRSHHFSIFKVSK